MPGARTLWNFDPTLCDLRGHHYAYAAALGEACARRQWRIVNVAHRYCTEPVRRSLAAEPFFRQTIHPADPARSRLGHLAGFICGNASLYRDLHAFDASRLGPRDIVLFHTISHDQLLAIWRWQRYLPEEGGPRVVLLLRYDPCHREARNLRHWRGPALYYRLALRALRHARRVCLATDSAGLATEYARLNGGGRIALLPIPHLPAPADQTPDAALSSQSDPAVRLVFAGDARLEKGFGLLAQAATRFARAGRAHFLVQCNYDAAHAADVRATIDTLAAAGEGVTLVREALDSVAYARLLASADAVLLPYEPRVYQLRTSGIYAEAMALGIPVIATRGTWMGEEAERRGLGGLLMEHWTPESLCRAIQRFIDAPQQWHDLARAASRRWCEDHSADRYLDILEALAAAG